MRNVITEKETGIILAGRWKWSDQFLWEVEIEQKEKLGKIQWGGENI